MQVDGEALASVAWFWSGSSTGDSVNNNIGAATPLPLTATHNYALQMSNETSKEMTNRRARSSISSEYRASSSQTIVDSLPTTSQFLSNDPMDFFGGIECRNETNVKLNSKSSLSRPNISIKENDAPTTHDMKCNKCNALIPNRELFLNHRCVEKNLSCPWPLCEYKTFRVDHLKIHVRKHTGERPYHCTYCDYRCNQKSQLNGHIYKKHMDK